MIKAVLFDMDGTLIDSSPGITRSARYALAHYGIEVSDLDSLRKFIGPPLWESFVGFYNFPEAQAKEAVEVYRERYNVTGIFECHLFQGVEECLKILKNEGYLIAVTSSKPEQSCKRILEHFQILELFDEVAGATFDGKIETKEEVLKELFRRWKHIKPEEMILIGDTVFDVNGAKKVGIDCIGVTFGFGHREEMEEAGAVAFCDRMDHLPKIIERYKNER